VRRLSAAEEARIADLLGTLRVLEPQVEVSGRVSRSVAGRRPGGAHTPTVPQLAAALAGSVLAAIAAIASLWGVFTLLLEVPAPSLLAALSDLSRAAFEAARACAGALGVIGRAALKIAQAFPVPARGGQLPILAGSVLSIACLLTLLLATVALLWRDLRRQEGHPRRMP
jgi:hypothetical protein